jgi:tetratricopeptide (TPR) repeat protein
LKSQILDEPVLVGREREIGELRQYIDSAANGQGKTVFISGEAGSGKTRLTAEFLDSIKNTNVTVLNGWCLSNAAVPYFPFVEAFDSYLSGLEDSKQIVSPQKQGVKSWLIGTSLTRGREAQENLAPQIWKEQTFSAVAKELMLLSIKEPTILVIEDIHWADSASLSLLHYISRVISSERILILATFRSEDLYTSSEGQPQPLVDTLRLMGREDLFKEIKLTSLNELDVGRIAESMLGGNVSQDLVFKLATESQGNPLFIVESLKMLHECGSLVCCTGKWQLSIEKLSIPSKVKDIILRRLSALKSQERRVLDAASVIGDKFDPELLGSVLGLDSLYVLETLNAIAHSNSLVCCEKNSFRFDHARSREVVYEEIFPPLRCGYHARIAERIEAELKNFKRPPVSDLAYHFAQAGNKEKSVKYSLEAGEDALSKFSNSEAIKHFKYVLDNTADPENIDQRARALEGLGSAHLENGLQSEAVKAFEQAAAASNSDQSKLRALRKAMFAANYQSDLATMKRLLESAKKITEVDPLESARIKLYRGTVSRKDEAVKDIEEALLVFQQEYSLSDIASALVEAGICYGEIGRLEESMNAGLRSLKLSSGKDDLERLIVYGHLVFDFLACGLFNEAVDTASEGIRIGEKIDNPRTGWIHVFSSLAHNFLALESAMSQKFSEASGHMKIAIAQGLKAVEETEKTDGYYISVSAYCALIGESAAIGDIGHSEEYDGKLTKLLERIGPKIDESVLKQLPAAKASLNAARSQWDEANSYYEKAIKSQENTKNASFFAAASRLAYAKILANQGRLVEAKMQSEIATRTIGEIKAKFEHARIMSSLIAPTRVTVGNAFNIRLDLVNITKKPARIEKIEGLITPNFEIVSHSDRHYLEDSGLIRISESNLNPFQVEPIELCLKGKNEGSFKLKPKVCYIDDMGKKCMSESKLVIVLVQAESKPNPVTVSHQLLTDHVLVKSHEYEGDQLQNSIDKDDRFDFKTKGAKETFDFLIHAFVEDYMKRRIAEEKAGWRTLVSIIKDGGIPTYSVYGQGRGGAALTELQQRNIVETRIFPGERGRGGKIMKARICYDKAPIRRYVDRSIMKNT